MIVNAALIEHEHATTFALRPICAKENRDCTLHSIRPPTVISSPVVSSLFGVRRKQQPALPLLSGHDAGAGRQFRHGFA